MIQELDEEEHYYEKQIYEVILEYMRDPSNVSTCIQTFEMFLENSFYKVYSSILNYYLAAWYIRVRKKDKLKQTLINLRSLDYSPKNSYDEYYFKGLLLCSDVLMNKDKFKPVKALIEKCLAFNKTSLLAFEYYHVLKEKTKENNLEILEKAFKMTDSKDPNLGYKLAMKYLEEENYVESFKVCKKVLLVYPKFKKIEKDVLIPVKEHLLKNY